MTLSIYLLAKGFPKDELYGLTNQIRRSSSSILSNIAEGCGRDSQAELARFLYIAMGSSSELDYPLILSHDLHYLDDKVYLKLSTELSKVRRMLNSFIQKVARDNNVEMKNC